MIRLSKRAQKIPPFIVMDVLERAHDLERQGRHIIHLEVGEPDFQTPECICKAGAGAIENGDTHYTHSQGTLEFREAVCEHYKKKYGVLFNPEQVIATSGTSPALFMIISALVDPGDEIIISDPAYPCYPNFVEFIGAKPVFVEVHEEDAFQLRPEEIRKKIGSKTRAIIVNSPSNPTGTLLSPDRMKEIADLGIPVISDEIYHGLVYGETEHSILEFTEDAFVINGFSKLYAMTGWRLGYIIATKDFVRPLQKIQQNFFVSAGSISQRAGIAALTEAEANVEEMIKTYDERRRYMIQRVRELGFGLSTDPAGAFYMLLNARHLSASSYDLAFEILEKAGVGVTPGIDFGK
ncbi:MAG: pyridoxal phosphate-dependent aminotransferase, partial [Deltaproteobacteria bacterium]|nr:pyridoxal phosphate-dependent aminotransferase [Deltaproteobacteria bacterium]